MNICLRGRKFENGNGKGTLLWIDVWLFYKPICIISHVLFDMCEDKNMIVHKFLTFNGHIQLTGDCCNARVFSPK
jgi:hypothetical protein